MSPPAKHPSLAVAPQEHRITLDASLGTRFAPSRYWAQCSCGWAGPFRPEGGHAGRDAEGHATAEAAARVERERSR